MDTALKTVVAPHAGAEPSRVPLVCIGLSSGGLSPLRTIFKNLDPNTGLAFAVLPHLSPTEPTQLPWLLSQWSKMPVEFAKNGSIVKPNHIYVIPPAQELTVRDGHLGIRLRTKIRGWSNVVTLFLNSLARLRRPSGIAVILSGMDSDGAAALAEFRERGGITIVQDPGSATYEDMPLAALKTGSADYVLTPEQIPAKLQDLSRAINRS